MMEARLDADLVGRSGDLERVAELMDASPLVTLTGVGGVGKTTLARACVERMDGVVWVDMAPVAGRDSVIAAFMRALGVDDPGSRAPVDALRAALGGRHVLLVVDNAEHVVRAVGELVVGLVRDVTGLGILVTSREPLMVPGESHLVVAPLAQDAARELFVHRARGYTAVPEDAPAIAQICLDLDGIPLAIEFAAAQMRSSSAQQVAASLGRALDLVGDGAPTRPRHVTLRAALSWSHDLLDPDEQVLLRRLSVFAGSFAPDAVEAVCFGEAALLERLVDQSMVTASPGEARYRLLETVRQFATDQLEGAGECEEVQARHAAFFVALAETAEHKLRTAEQLEWHRRLQADYDNIVMILQRGVDRSSRLSDDGGRMASALGWWWIQFEGRQSEASRWLTRAAAQLDDPAAGAPLAKAAVWAGIVDWTRGDPVSASTKACAALPLLDGGDPWAVATARMMSDLSPMSAGPQERQAWFAACLEAYQAADDDGFGAWLVHLARGVLAIVMGAHDERRAANEARLEIARRLGDDALTVQPLVQLAAVALLEDDPERAAALLGEAAVLGRPLGAGSITAILVGTSAWLATARGDFAEAVRLFGALDGLLERSGAQVNFANRAEFDTQLGRCREALDPPAFDREWTAGRTLAAPSALALAEDIIGGRTAPEAGTLTPRQREVAALVAQGKSNREIAAALTISEHTAERHIENILRALHLQSRVQVATWYVADSAPLQRPVR